ncbi:hypothetical protein PHLGIDRAFT_121271 [Phlebiopsis gigantea 11061_1 CR5-6]|uniref:Uncharacterized protein n=1 Tax=Phlebiopsis gigantea (strain 11061_1 CR5-6) TaxID=745531 RepID=A0A0C3S5Y2_PHLG1|nr:hypothetical protein PHLGIDRAFT_121271 [Phlebiopsis gigantea 11061_1 CR5-6]
MALRLFPGFKTSSSSSTLPVTSAFCIRSVLHLHRVLDLQRPFVPGHSAIPTDFVGAELFIAVPSVATHAALDGLVIEPLHTVDARTPEAGENDELGTVRFI